MVLLMVIFAMIAGLSLALQGPVNSALGRRTTVLQATAVSFTGGVILLGLLLPLFGQGTLMNITKAKPWQLLGGIYGVTNAAVVVAAIPVLGAALTLTAIMLGQLLAAALIDVWGLFGTEPYPISFLRIAGIIIVAFGILLIYKGNKTSSTTSKQSVSIPMLLVSFIAGILGAFQAPTNAALSRIVGKVEGAFVSFTVGLIPVLLVLLFIGSAKRRPLKGAGIKPWMLTGGAFGVTGVFLGLYTIPTLGAALQIACCLTGMLVGGILTDTFGLLQSAKIKINPYRILGVLVILTGVALVTLDKMH